MFSERDNISPGGVNLRHVGAKTTLTRVSERDFIETSIIIDIGK